MFAEKTSLLLLMNVSMSGTFTDTCKVSILCGPFPNYVPTALGVRQSSGF